MSNYNFCARVDEQRFFVRCQSEFSSELGIDRFHEVSCQQRAAEAGIAPRVLWHCPEHHCLVSEWLSGCSLGEDPEPVDPVMLAGLVTRLHQLKAPAQHLDLPVRANWYWKNIPDCLKSPERTVLHRKLLAYCQRVKLVSSTFCHHDLNPNNVMQVEGRLWLVDWEYAAAGDPAFDLATILYTHNCDPAWWQQFLRSYSELSGPAWESRIEQMIPLLEWSSWLWAMVMSQGDGAFDCLGYAEQLEHSLRQHQML